MMEPWKCIQTVEAALKPDRPVVCVCPNITQVTYLVSHIKEQGLGLCLWRTIEVAHRTWDIRPPAAHPSFRQVTSPRTSLALWLLALAVPVTWSGRSMAQGAPPGRPWCIISMQGPPMRRGPHECARLHGCRRAHSW
jgi:hypothetical protein